jgi:TPP-dependent pyruvate/acetoin dehydrogenase alpha subunit
MFELTVARLFKEGEIKGVVHISIGQEAAEVGACFALKKDDYIVGNHRSHGHNLAKGARMDRLLAEILGKSAGYNRGRAGSMNATAVEVGNLFSTAIVGANLSLAVGAGLTAKMKKTGKVTLCFFGEGASNTGSIAERASSYSMPGISIDGNDVFAVYRTVCKAVEKARRGEGPSLIECRTYRWEGHYVGDPKVYRSKEEENKWKKKDPIKRFKSRLIKMKIYSIKEVEIVHRQVKQKIDEALKFSAEAPETSGKEVMDYLYSPSSEEVK